MKKQNEILAKVLKKMDYEYRNKSGLIFGVMYASHATFTSIFPNGFTDSLNKQWGPNTCHQFFERVVKELNLVKATGKFYIQIHNSNGKHMYFVLTISNSKDELVELDRNEFEFNVETSV